MSFINLHLHTNYSWDCISKIPDVVKYIKNDGQNAVAITDHGSISGCFEFFKECKKQKVKPIIGCLLGHQEIFTKCGIKKIKDIKSGDMVYTHTGKLEPVLGTMTREYSGDLYTVYLANSDNRKLEITGEHPILIADNKGNKKWVPVSEINFGRIQNYSTSKISGITNYKSYVCCPKIYGTNTTLNTNDLIHNTFNIQHNNISKKYKLSKYDTLDTWETFGDTIELDKKFCYFWGLFLAEGSVNTKDNIYGTTGQCHMTFNIKESVYVDFCRNFLKERFNINATIYERAEKSTLELTWCNLPFATLLLALCGNGSHNKNIHNIAFSMPLHNQKFLLQGIIDGDCKHLTENNKTKQQTLRVASELLAWDFRQLLINFGTFSRVAKDKSRDIYSVPYLPYSKYKRCLEDDQYVYYPIKKINKSQINTTVYNLHVKNDNSYLSDYALHNCEFYICKNQEFAKLKDSSNKSLNHLVVLAKNYTGYTNLLMLTKIANENFYHKPRIDEATLFKYSDGLIVLNGHIDTSIHDCLFFNYEAASQCDTIDCAKQYLYPDYKERFLAVAERYSGVFGDDFYIECQLFDKVDIGQQVSGYILKELADEFKLKSVGTGDCHYIVPSDAVFHKTYCGIKLNKKINELSDIRYYTSGMYGIITNKWAEDCYPQELIAATQEIADKIESFDIIKQEAIPEFGIDNPREYLMNECKKQLVIKGLDNQIYNDRLKYEMEILELGNLYDYFLIVQDYCNWAESNDILMSPGRGCLEKTNIFLANGDIKDISKVKVGDLVICDNGMPNKVLKTMMYPCDEDRLQFLVGGGDTNGITLTKDHKVLAIKRLKKAAGRKYIDLDSEPKWYRADELSAQDLLVQPMPIDNTIPLTEINLEQLCGNQNSKSKILNFPQKIKIDKDFCYMLGVFTGDGWFKKDISDTRVSFCFNSETGLLAQSKIIKYMEKIGCTTSKILSQNGKKVNQIHFTNKVINNLFRYIFPDYIQKAETKTVPDVIMSQSKENIISYIDGLIEADGHIDNKRCKITTVSQKLAYQIKYLLLKCGIPSHVHSTNRVDSRPVFKNRKTEYNVLFSKTLTYYKVYDNKILTPIRKINKVTGQSTVYDIKVENKSNYLTTSGIVHNSAGGCLVSYLTNIINIDPLEYGLLFDRFYSKDRAENKVMPDIDTDFPASRRQDVVEYIRNKYGHDKVAGVVTFSTLQGKNALKDVLRTHGACSFQEMNKLTDLLPNRDKISDKLAEFKEETGSDSIIYYCLKNEPDLLKDYCRIEADNGIEVLSGDFAEYFKIAIGLEGAIKSESKHASAIIISKYPLHTVAPMIRDKSSDELLVGLDMDSFPLASLVKFDILGLKSLDCLTEVNNILEEIGI